MQHLVILARCVVFRQLLSQARACALSVCARLITGNASSVACTRVSREQPAAQCRMLLPQQAASALSSTSWARAMARCSQPEQSLVRCLLRAGALQLGGTAGTRAAGRAGAAPAASALAGGAPASSSWPPHGQPRPCAALFHTLMLLPTCTLSPGCISCQALHSRRSFCKLLACPAASDKSHRVAQCEQIISHARRRG